MSQYSLSDVAIHANAADNVAVTKCRLPAGTEISPKGGSLSFHLCSETLPGALFALGSIPAGLPVRYFGQIVGLSQGIEAGQIVNQLNTLVHSTELTRRVAKTSLPTWEGTLPVFNGFLRVGTSSHGVSPDGQAGVRNWVAVIPTSMCASHEANRIAETATLSGLYSRERWQNVDGITSTPHTFGCGCTDRVHHSLYAGQRAEVQTVLEMLGRVAIHPNVGAVLFVELGCEKTNLGSLAKALTGDASLAQLSLFLGKPVEYLTLQRAGGTKAAIRSGLESIGRLLVKANQFQRQPLPLSKLILGLKCGGSDVFSGLTANPALGVASDLLIRAGGRSLITEIPEFAGAEHLFAARAATPEVEDNILGMMQRYQQYLEAHGSEFEDNPSPGNREGGLFNICVKSLGALAKSGQAPVVGTLEYLENVWSYPENGLYLLYGPGYDQVSTPALVASGCQMVCFTTGRGTGIGNAIAPVIKISSNSELKKSMAGDIDIDSGKILQNSASLDEVGQEIFDFILSVASGQVVCAEENEHREFTIWIEEKVTL